MRRLPVPTPATRAQAPHLDDGPLGSKARPVGAAVDRRKYRVRICLGHAPAGFAGEHQLAHLVAGVAGEEGVAAFEAMHDARRHERFDGAVDGDGCQPFAPGGQPFTWNASRARSIASSRQRSWSCSGAGKALLATACVIGPLIALALGRATVKSDNGRDFAMFL